MEGITMMSSIIPTGVENPSSLNGHGLACTSHSSKVVATRQHSSSFSCSFSSCGALRIPSRSSVSNSRDGDQVHRRRRSGSSTSIACIAKSEGTKRTERAEGPPFNLSAVLVPMLAAAVVGGMQPNVQALEEDQFSAPDDDTETVEGVDAQSPNSFFKGLLQRIKESRSAREKNSPTPDIEKQSDGASITNSSPFAKSAPVYQPPPAPPAPPIRESPPPPSPAVKQSSLDDFVKEPSVVTEVTASDSSKTHGFLPLFLAQLLLLVATGGGGYVLITTPDSKWTDLQKAVDGYVGKATPIVEDSWTKAKPVVAQVQQQAQRFGEAAKPYLIKAWETAVPLVGKAAEASKPVLKAAQSKATELLKQGKSDS